MSKVSVIIPVYNAEPYLRRCLDSVLGQTLADWEAVCVDDGSTDGSAAILDDYAGRDARFRVIHQPNRGTLVARKVAVAAATGAWCLFLDPDDELTPQACERLVAGAEESGADVIACGVELKADGVSETTAASLARYMNRPAWTGSAEEALTRQFIDGDLPWNLIAKMARAPLCREAFGEQADVFATKCEDACSMFRLLLKAQRVAVIEDRLYVYRVGVGISTRSILSPEEVVAAFGISRELEAIQRLVDERTEPESAARVAAARFRDRVSEGCCVWIMDRIDSGEGRVAALGALTRNALNGSVLRAIVRRFTGRPQPVVELLSQACARLRDERAACRRWADEAARLRTDLEKMRTAKLLAVHLHLFYPEQLPRLLRRLKALELGDAADLFVTYPADRPDLGAAAEKVKVVFPAAEVIALPNAGYDIAPFLEVIRRLDLDRYRYVLKLHTKGRGRDWNLTRLGGRLFTDALWTDTLTDALVGSPAAFEHALRVLGGSPDVGLVSAAPCLVKDNPIRASFMRAHVNAELRARGLAEVDDLVFVAGTMFMVRAAVLKPLAAGTSDAFGASLKGEKDYSTAHVYERLFAAAVVAQGLSLRPLPARRRPLEAALIRLFQVSRWVCKGAERKFVKARARLTLAGCPAIRRSTRPLDAALVAQSRFFNATWYLWRNRDVRESGVHPAVHYVTQGWKEGRWPSAFFSPSAFVAANPDTEGRCPVLFYERNGRYENRMIGTGLAHGWTARIPGYLAVRRLLARVGTVARLVKSRNVTALGHLVRLYHSREFDARWYLRAYEDVRYSFADPALHYLTAGWREGRDPSPRFSTCAYLATNPDVQRAGGNPLLHWLAHGRAEGRATGLVFPVRLGFSPFAVRRARRRDRRLVARNRGVRILVHVHLFYPELWDAIAAYLSNLSPYVYRLVVTYPSSLAGRHVLEKIAAFHDDVVLREYENRGFDIGPFLDYLNEVDLSAWDIVYHLHSKGPASTTKGRFVYGRLFRGDDWFRQLYEGCLGCRNVHKVVDALAHDPDVGFCCADNLVFTDEPGREELVRLYAGRLSVEVPAGYRFVGGTCFAAKAKALESVQRLGLGIGAFKESCRFIFTLGHAMERIVPIMMQRDGYALKPFPVQANRHVRVVARLSQAKAEKEAALVTDLTARGVAHARVLHLDLVSGMGLKFAEGTVDGHRVFVKVGGDAEAAANEAEKMRALAAVLPGQVPTVRLFDPAVPLVAMDRIPAVNLELLMNVGLAPDVRDDIVRQLADMRDRLAASRYLHRDIRPANLVYHDGRLWLLDFQFMVERRDDGTFDELPFVVRKPVMASFIGDIYKTPEPGWDDRYSFDKIIEEVKAL